MTGTPGCGKTQFAKKLALRKKLRYVPLHEILVKEKIYRSYDRRLQSYEVDVRRVRKLLRDLILVVRTLGEGLVIDGHLSHYAPPSLVDRCYVVRCDLRTLKRRLQRRGYSKRKIRENLDAEILDVCLVEALEAGHQVQVIKR